MLEMKDLKAAFNDLWLVKNWAKYFAGEPLTAPEEKSVMITGIVAVVLTIVAVLATIFACSKRKTSTWVYKIKNKLSDMIFYSFFVRNAMIMYLAVAVDANYGRMF